MKVQKREKEIVPVRITNGVSANLTIPIELARHYCINKPTYVTIEGTKDGILIKPMEFEE